MSQDDREEWSARIAADPALRAAWDEYRFQLARSMDQAKAGAPPDLEALRRAADNLLAHTAEDKTRH